MRARQPGEGRITVYFAWLLALACSGRSRVDTAAAGGVAGESVGGTSGGSSATGGDGDEAGAGGSFGGSAERGGTAGLAGFAGKASNLCDWDCYPGYSGRQWCGDLLLAVGFGLDTGEACDDGNQTGGDGCSGDCKHIEPGFWCPPVGPCTPAPDCRIVNGVCAGTPSPVDYGLGCTAACQLAPFCGDGVVQSEFGELCDAGPPGKSPYGGCTWDCQPGPYCGDGRVDVPFGEACDEGPLNGAPDGECSPYCTRNTAR